MAISQIITNSIASGQTITTPTLSSPTISGTYTAGTSLITSGTAQASTTGTSIDFTSIPSWVKRVTIMFSGVSTNASSALYVQVGSGSVSTTGYASQVWAGSTGSGVLTTGFCVVSGTGAAAYAFSGHIVLTLISNNTWIESSMLAYDNVTSVGWQSAGKSPTLSGALDRVRITAGGTDTFDAGNINILYE